ncbi:MAG TPA: type II toxin-antitoxin system RatA family toxin [Rhodanobacteraceae bacterium]|nr:type II toxin-antitoxin system RatA family toxin [Rhodanobacteraceae bacterium]
MTHVHRQALVRHTPEQMFDLVNDVEAYPRRFAWCADAKVRERGEDFLVARMDLRFAGFTQHFVTRNTIKRPRCIAMHFVEGPFRTLTGEWLFTPLGEKLASPGPAGRLARQAGEGELKQPASTSAIQGCKVSLTLDFEINNPLTGLALRIGFQKLADRMVDDFVAQSNRTDA